MPWIGTAPNQTVQRSDGTRSGSTVWQSAKAASVKVVATGHDTHDEDIAQMIDDCLKKDGGNSATANIPMGGFLLTGLGSPTAQTDAARFSDIRVGMYSASVGGTGNAITLTPTPAMTAYAAGQLVSFKAAASNTGATTVNISGLGAKDIRRNDGAATALVSGDIVTGQICVLGYDGTRFLLVSGSNLALDDTLSFDGSGNLQREALTGAIAATAGSNATTSVTSMVVTIGDGVNVLTTGTKGYVSIDYAATITGWTIVALQSGSCVVDVWKAAAAIPTNANTITGSEKPTLSSQQRAQDASLSSWTTAVSANDVFGFEIESATTCTQVTVTIKMTKTS